MKTQHMGSKYILQCKANLSESAWFDQGWEFAHSLILLISLKSIEQLWAICSDRSRQMSDLERFAQVAHDKWANERFAQKILYKI